MSQLTRLAIGFLSIAAIGYLIAYANPDESLGDVAGALGMLIAIMGFAMLAWSMFKPTEDEPRATATPPQRRGTPSA